MRDLVITNLKSVRVKPSKGEFLKLCGDSLKVVGCRGGNQNVEGC